MCGQQPYSFNAVYRAGAARTALSAGSRVRSLASHLIPKRSDAQTHQVFGRTHEVSRLQGGANAPPSYSRKSEALFLVVWVAQVSPPRFRK